MFESVIEVEYVPTAEDLAAGQAYMIGESDSATARRLMRRRLLVSAIVGPPTGLLAVIGGAVIVLAIQKGFSVRPGLWAALAVFGVFWLSQIVRALTASPNRGAYRRNLERVLRETAEANAGHSCLYRFDDEGITHEQQGVVMFFPWSAVEKVDHGPGMWHFVLLKRGMFLNVSEREIPDVAAFEALVKRNVGGGVASG